MRFVRSCVALFLVAAGSSAANAVAVIGGSTAVRVTADLAALGLTPALTGTATLDTSIPEIPRILFPVTGGDLNPVTLGGTIRHDGSGVTLSAGGNTLSLGNFVIDTVNTTLFGDVALNGSSIGTALPLFSFSLSGLTPAQITNTLNPQIRLLFTSTSAGALTQVFGAPNLEGAQFGLAATAPALVPEPATWAMMIAGFGLVGISLRRRALKRVAA